MHLRLSFPFNSRRITPKIFQTVERAFVAMKNMHNHLKIIEHDPLTRGEPVHRDCAHTVIFLQTGLDLIRDRFQLRLGRGRTNHEKIGEGRNPAHIEHNDLFRLFVRGELSASFG